MRKISTLWSTSAKYSVLTTGATVMTRLSPRDLFFKTILRAGAYSRRAYSRGTFPGGHIQREDLLHLELEVLRSTKDNILYHFKYR